MSENVINQENLAQNVAQNNEAQAEKEVQIENSQENAPKPENTENPKDKKAQAKGKKDDGKPKPEPEKKESMSFRCEQFFGKNWKYLFFFLILAIIVVAYEISTISSKMASLEKIVMENNGKVVMTTTDGRALRVMKEPLKAEFLKQFAVSTIVNHLVVDRKRLTGDFNKLSFKNYDEALNTVQAFKIFYENFLPSQQGEVDKVAIGYFVSYLQWLINAVAQDKLPEYISVKDYVIDAYTYEGSGFHLEVSIKIVANSYLLNENRYVNSAGVMQIAADGTFDLLKSTDGNPYGLRFNKLKIIPVLKPTSGYVQ